MPWTREEKYNKGKKQKIPRNVDHANDIALQVNTPTQAENLLRSLLQALASIQNGMYVL